MTEVGQRPTKNPTEVVVAVDDHVAEGSGPLRAAI
jgi:hypothetical protein